MTTTQSALVIGGAAIGGIVGTFIFPGVGTFAGAGLGAGVGGIAAAAVAGGSTVRAKNPPPARLTAGAIGHTIPWALGCNAIAGKVKHLGPRIDKKRKESVGKSLFGGPKTETIESFQSFAMSFGEGPIVGITRMWQNNDLFFDVTDSNTGPTVAGYLTDAVSGFSFPAPTAQSPGQVDTKDFGSFTYTLGTYDQLPDAEIQSDIRIAEAIGGSPLPDPADFVDAGRHEVMVYFHRWPLAASNGVRPQIDAEVITAGSATYPLETYTFSVGDFRILSATWSADLTKLHQTNWNNPYRIVDYDSRNFGSGIKITPLPDGGFPQQLGNSRVYSHVYSTSGQFVHQLDAQTGAEIWKSDVGAGAATIHVEWIYEFPEGLLPKVVVKGSDDGRLSAFDALVGIKMWSFDYDNIFSSNVRWQIWPQEVNGALYIAASKVSDAARIVKINPFTGGILAEYLPQIDSPASSDDFYDDFEMTYDEITNSLILLKNQKLRRFSLTTLTVDATDISAPAASNFQRNDQILKMRPYQGQLWLQYSIGNSYVRIDTSSFSIVETISVASDLWTSLPLPNQWPLYSPRDGALVLSNSTASAIYILQQRLGHSTITERIAVEAITARCGIPAAQVDATAGTNALTGVMASSQVTGRAVLQDLFLAFNSELRHQDFVLQLMKHGGASNRTIPEAHLGAMASRDGSGAEVDLSETRSAELDMDQMIDVSFVSLAREHTADVGQYARAPEAVRARDQARIDLPIVFPDGTEPAQIAERLTVQDWVRGRNAVAVPLPRVYLDLNIGDVFDTTQNGDAYRLMVVKRGIDEDLILRTECVPEEQWASLVSAAPAAVGIGNQAQTIPSIATVNFDVLDIPLLRDQDEGLIKYSWADPSSPTNVFIHRSQDDGATFPTEISVFASGEEAEWGIATTALADADYHFTDRTNTVDVTMQSGTLASVTLQDAVNGANAFLIGNEIVIARTVTSLGGNDYRLSNLIRGRRGTDVETGGHVANELFLVLATTGIDRAVCDLSELNQTRIYTATTSGGTVGSGPRRQLTYTGKSKKPYAPGHLTGVKQGDNSWDLEAIGRTRLGHGPTLGVAPFLADPANYTVALLASAEGAEVGTPHTGLTTAATTFTDAEIATAYGSPASAVNTIYVSWVHVSATVGAGFKRYATHTA